MIRSLALVLSAVSALAAQEIPGAAPTTDGTVAPSPWYAERGSKPRPPGPLDPVSDTANRLVALLRDGGIPGFYDGQFASVADRFDDLAALASDPDLNHVLRVMAVMALQEAGSGPPLAEVLDPLIVPARDEVNMDDLIWQARGRNDDPLFIDQIRRADLSVHARFALAKDGQPARVLEKIREMELRIGRRVDQVLDPTLDSDMFDDIGWKRQLIFDIGYHYQQFDDFARASEWFRKLTDALPGQRETRWAHYNLACIAALQGRPDDAMAHLNEAWKVGFADVAWMLQDGDLKSLRDRPDFQALAAAMRGLDPPPAEPAGRGPRDGR